MLENLLSIRILARPKDKERAEELAERLNGSIVWYEEDSQWSDVRRAWMELAQDNGEFGLVIRDDAILCDNFIEEVQKLIIRTHHYRTVYQLCINDNHKKFTKQDIEFSKDVNYVFGREYNDTSATIIPKALILDIVRYGNQSFYVGDEMKIKTFLLRYAIPVTYPYPELVTREHYGHTTEE